MVYFTLGATSLDQAWRWDCSSRTRREHNIFRGILYRFALLNLSILADRYEPKARELDPNPDPKWQKLPTKIGKKWRNFMFWNAACSFWGLQDSTVAWASLMEAYRGVNCKFWSKKFNLCSAKFFSVFGHQHPGSGSALQILKPMRIRNTGIHISFLCGKKGHFEERNDLATIAKC